MENGKMSNCACMHTCTCNNNGTVDYDTGMNYPDHNNNSMYPTNSGNNHRYQVNSNYNNSAYTNDMNSGSYSNSVYNDDMNSGSYNNSVYNDDMNSGGYNNSVYTNDMNSGSYSNSVYNDDMNSGSYNNSVYTNGMNSGSYNNSAYNNDMNISSVPNDGYVEVVEDPVITNNDNGYAYDANIGYSNPNWMSKIPGNKKISELSIPGTHGSIALHGASFIDENITRNQRMSITTQLNSGIRYLDIRARRTGIAFAMHHGMVYQQKMFGDILNEMTAFLRQNSGETILMRLKEEHDAESGSLSFEEILTRYWNNYQQYFWQPSGSQNPTLNEVRGKVVVLQDFSASRSFGISYGNLNKQDNYNVSKSPDSMYAKWTAVGNHLKAADASNKQSIYLNYLSGTQGQGAITGGGYPWFVASGYRGRGTNDGKEMIQEHRTDRWPDFPRGYYGQVFYGGMNLLTTQYIQQWPIAHAGIIAADFPGRGLIDRVIRLNDRFLNETVRYITPKGSSGLRIGFGGDVYLRNHYVVRLNGIYIGEVNNGQPYYSYWDRTDVGHDLRFEGLPLFTGDKVDVFVKNGDNLMLLKSQILSVDEQEGEEIRVPNGHYRIQSALKNTSVVDMNLNGNNIYLWDYVKQLNAEFTLQYDEAKKSYVIWNRFNPTLVMAWNAVPDSINVFGTPFDATKDEHYWKVKRAGNGYVYLENLKNGNVLDVIGGGTSNGTNISVWGVVPGAMNQKLKLVQKREIKRASIVSQRGPQPGQKNRSSGNFSLGSVQSQQVRVMVRDANRQEAYISFRVMYDKSGDTDPTIWSNVRNGSIVTVPSGASSGKLYIANPNGANSNFTVEFYTLEN
ncbi:phosphatidylinositol-specific phospholipase C domain-containing protein [Bacillus thuringiensis]|uniref:phosphatidylinositol-specific phospholipase C domain-containing protein n=1 Tax=Bacillus thuringiensis TaxID=1428 RepID=UPI002ABC7332|nr:phosphatidylinositol-specific phospholipase C domain-containing protein [Bacillus thuringiensis]MDZ3952419.1 phosphatidylinositol-specific phospholipase C domain-containing protein [Bacillus thuringiensis]